jgi:prophage antirepressor-like protein
MQSEGHITFEFESEKLPVFIDSQKRVWIHAARACIILGMKNPTLAVQRHVSPNHRRQISVGVGMPAWYVTEPGFYQLVFKSKTDIAEKFRDWVFEEVLPAIRKDGGYISPSATKEQLEALQKQVDIYSRAFWNMAHAQTSNRTVEKEIDKVRFLLPGVSEPKTITD